MNVRIDPAWPCPWSAALTDPVNLSRRRFPGQYGRGCVGDWFWSAAGFLGRVQAATCGPPAGERRYAGAGVPGDSPGQHDSFCSARLSKAGQGYVHGDGRRLVGEELDADPGHVPGRVRPAR